MTWPSTILHKNRRILRFGLAIILLVLTAVSPDLIRTSLGNFSSLLFIRPFSELKNYLVGLQNVATENVRLKSLIAESSLQLNILNEIKRENQRLREFLGFEPPVNYGLVPVKIVAIQANGHPLAAVINKGQKASISVDQPVVNRFGLVGKVKEVMPDFATVALLTDPSNAVSGRVAESRQIGIVRFSPERGMYFDDLPADAEIKPGDLIVSSGLGGIYPAGLAVAIVDSVSVRKGDILKMVRLSPTVDFFSIDELYVLISGNL